VDKACGVAAVTSGHTRFTQYISRRKKNDCKKRNTLSILKEAPDQVENFGSPWLREPKDRKIIDEAYDGQ
jgi:CRISPR/Cas system CMR-associated protein Cmr5 small subunit